MDIPDKILFKNRLKLFCQQIIQQRIAAAKELIKSAQDAANSEEKSSAGDKYETGRAMGHLQKDMHASQMNEYLKELSSLQLVNTNLICNNVSAGAFIQTPDMSFFIAAGLGKQNFENQLIYFVSPHAPLAAVLKNRIEGDYFIFGKQSVLISAVY